MDRQGDDSLSEAFIAFIAPSSLSTQNVVTQASFTQEKLTCFTEVSVMEHILLPMCKNLGTRPSSWLDTVG